MLNWFVAQSEYKQGFKARDELRSLGFESYLPIHVKRMALRGKRVQRNYELLPGYLMVRAEMTDETFARILDCRGIRGLLRGCGDQRPIPVPDDAIRHLRDVEADRNKVRRYAAGDIVAVIGGLFEGKKARVLRLDNGGKLRVEILDIGAARPVTLNRAAIEPVTASAATAFRSPARPIELNLATFG